MTCKKLLLLFLITVSVDSFAQSAIFTTVRLTGNINTKDHVILREVLLEKDSAYWVCSKGNLGPLVEQSKNRILNLNLFNKVDVKLNNDSFSNGYSYYSLDINVVEKWYIWPIPFVEFSDRNFNVWGGLSFDAARTNYGLYAFNYNLFGLNHTLKTNLKTGYNTEIGLEYRIPYINEHSNWGINTLAKYASQNEVWYGTTNDTLQFFKNGKKNLIQSTQARVELTKRIRPMIKLSIGAGIEMGKLDSSVSSNDYFLNNANNQTNYGFDIMVESDTRDNIYFPVKGIFFQPKVVLQHWTNNRSTNNLKLQLKVQHFWRLSHKWYSALSYYTQYNTERTLPYSTRKMFGYDEIIRGFEKYVIDGNYGWKGNVAIRYHLLNKSNLKLNFVPIKNYKVLPFNIYLEAYGDGGKVSYQSPDATNKLVNQFLYSGGLGLNTLFYNDRLLRLEYSLNSLGEGGFFVHFKKAI
ncbi:MAG: hypothetical protein COA58_08525 [Bacteroidetes bacterium]|nr:MAG: hypothetical protein COA58_08525 [Bacteroidota bacterium]